MYASRRLSIIGLLSLGCFSSLAFGQSCPCTIWSPASAPAILDSGDGSAGEFGVKFRADVNGLVTGIRFYKGAANGGAHVGNLWDSSGTLLATVVFSGESATDWQEAQFATPVPVTAGTTYVASYFAPLGHYSYSPGFFSSGGTDTPPLHALADGIDGGNGVYSYSNATVFPQATYGAANYWVDVVFATTEAPGGPTVASYRPQSGLTPVGVRTAVTATFGAAVDSSTVSATTFQLLDPLKNTVAASVTYDSATRTATLQPDDPLATSTEYTAVVMGGSNGAAVKDSFGAPLAASFSWSFVTAHDPGICPCTIWDSAAMPAVADGGDPTAVELGVRFRADVDGVVTGLRFYKSAANTGVHIGNLWANDGTLLASATFAGESASGWQQIQFNPAVPVVAGTTYVASYFAPAGHYSVSPAFFAATGLDSPPLHALADMVDGANGVFAYGATSAFPTQSYGASNYWLDVVFDLGAPPAAPSATSVTPSNGASGVAATTVVTATFSAPVAPTTVTTATFQLLDSSYHAVPCAVGYDAGTLTASLQPSSPLTPGENYMAIVGRGVQSPSGTPLAATVAWSFSVRLTSPPPVVVAYSPANGATAVAATALVTATFDRAMDPASVTGPNFQLLDGAGATVSAVVSYNAATKRAVLQPSAALGFSTLYTAVVRAGGPRDTTGLALARTVSWTFTTVGPPPPTPTNCPCTIWPAAAAPALADSGENTGIETGVKFRADMAGFITGLRFYKSALNGGVHVGNLWSSSGTLLASATFVAESDSGWQQINFSSPVAVSANTTYVASYYAPWGHYSVTLGGFATAGVDKIPLHALESGVDGVNGVYVYATASSFPTQAYSSSNYWVDVVFVPGNYTATPQVISTTPANGANSVSIASNLTVLFNEPLNAATTGAGSVQVVDAGNNVIPGSITYTASTASIVFTPATGLAPSTTYNVTVKGTVCDAFGNAMGSDFQFSFTTGAAPLSDGPGGPILVVSSTQNPFSRYYSEILLNEGLNEFTVSDINNVTPAVLASYDIVILGDIALTSSQASLFASWVNGGGNLIAMHPDRQLAGLLGLSYAGSTLSNAYLAVDTTTGAGAGIVSQPIQFHGPADLYTATGATALATLYSSSSAPTTFPAVTWTGAGAGQAAAFTYDLARSVILTRQGNPAWSGQDRDGYVDPALNKTEIRANDLFYGNATYDPQLDWVDLNQVQIPQADEQQRLLANLIQLMNANKKPLPRFWYFPGGFKAVVIMTGDDHNSGGTNGRFDHYLEVSPAGCSVADWTCVRATAYVWPSTPIPTYQAYVSEGFEIANHADSIPTCVAYTPPALDAAITSQLTQMNITYPGLPASRTNRTHCVLWSDYDSQPTILLNHGIRLDTSYYYWPSVWILDRPGLFTGSGMPMRYADRNGNTIDVYQATTQMTDESGQSYPLNIDTLLDNALSPLGFYGAFTANMHNDSADSPDGDLVLASAQARGVPIVSSLQMLTWLDGRNSSSFGSLSWSGKALNFTITAGSGARNLQAMLPVTSSQGPLKSIAMDGSPVGFTRQTIKGVTYATFSAVAGSYQATYATPHTISGTVTGAGGSYATLSLGGAATGTAVADASGNFTFGTVLDGSYTVRAAKSGYTFTPASAAVTVAGANVTGVNFTSVAATSTSVALDALAYADSDRSATSITSRPFSTVLGNEVLLAFVGGGDAGASETVTSVTGGGLTWELVQRTNANGGTAEVWRALAAAPLTNILVTANFSAAVPASSITVAAFSGVDSSGANGSGAIGATVSGSGGDGVPARVDITTTQNNSWVFAVGNDAAYCASHEPVDGQSLVHELQTADCHGYWVQRVTGTVPVRRTTVDVGVTIPEADSYNLTVVEIVPLVPKFKISGIISGVGGNAATVVLSGGSDATTTADSSGHYTFTGLPADTYTVTPTVVGYSYTPASSQVTIRTADVSGVNFSSTGVPVVSLAPDPAAFGTQLVGTPSAAHAITLSNVGHASLRIDLIFIDGADVDQFSETHTCGATLAAGASCAINGVFVPTDRGSASAFITLNSNADSSPDYAGLTGTGIAAVASFSPTSLSFGNQLVNTTSSVRTVTLTNTGDAVMSIAGMSIAGDNPTDFSQTNTCGTSLAINARCTISVTFKPTAMGSRSATVLIIDNALANPHNVNLSGTGTAPIATLSPTSVTFAIQPVNTTSSASTVTLRNTGTATMTISSTTITGTNASEFTRTTTCGSSLNANASCTFSVTFRPTAYGSRTASLSITDSAAGSPHTVPLSGMGTGVTVTPATVTFANQQVGTTSAAQVITVKNVGTTTLTAIVVALSGTNPSDFARTTTCGTSLNTGASCTISVTFSPTATGTRSASIAVTDSDPTSPQQVALTGTGTAPVASVSPTSVAFGIQVVNTSSSASTVTLRNTGTAAMTISGITITGTSAADFSRTTTCGTSLNVNASCTISVTYRPTVTGAETASVSIADNAAGSPHTVSLTGTGTGVTVSPTSLSFSSWTVGTTSPAQAVTVRNVGSNALTGIAISLTGSNPTDFGGTNTCGTTLAGGASCTVNVTFTPTANGTRSATLVIADSDPASPQQVALSGTGTSPIASVSPTSLTFATQAVNTSSSASNVTLRNTGNVSMTISSITFGGTNAADFSRTTTCGSTLNANSSCTISVTFRPTAAGARTANLSIADNAAGSPHTVSLSGTGTGVTVSPTSLSFSTRTVGTTSTAQTVTLRNVGTTTLTAIVISLAGTYPGDYARTTTCGTTLAAGGSCTISVTFTPRATGSRPATLQIADSDPTTPQQVSLTGTGR